VTSFALDTSVAVPLLLETHPAHQQVLQWAQGHTLAIPAHALVETYSVLTRLPAEMRVSSNEVNRVIDDSFSEILVLPPKVLRQIHHEFASAGIIGGAVYDGLVGITARENRLTLVSRDSRAAPTYATLSAPNTYPFS
jgi:predicted nucleic acid-binding protein